MTHLAAALLLSGAGCVQDPVPELRLGVKVVDTTPPPRDVLVREVTPGAVGERLGLKVDDAFVQVNNETIRSCRGLLDALKADTVTVVWRCGTKFYKNTARRKLSAARDEDDVPGPPAEVFVCPAYFADGTEKWPVPLGVVIARPPADAPLVLALVARGRLADALGLRAGDVLEAVNGRPVLTLDALDQALRTNQTIPEGGGRRFQIGWRRGETRFRHTAVVFFDRRQPGSADRAYRVDGKPQQVVK